MKSTGIGLTGATFLVFLILKLAEIGQVATWSWWWVTCPLWIGLAIVIVLIIIVAVITGTTKLFEHENPKYSNEKPKSKFQQKLEEAKANSERLKN